MPSVAVTGDVVATASTATTFRGAGTGSWQAGPVSETAYPKLTVGGASVIHQAQCTFTFTDSVTAATSLSVVTLRASATPLQGGLSNVLLDGDRTTDVDGNSLQVRAAQPPTLESAH